MTTRVVRKIVKIDEEKCNGCGLCVPGCVEGALQIVDGKARLISEQYCDGLGACLGQCPQGAITIEERPAEEFDEELAKQHMVKKEHVKEKLPCGCPSAMVTQFEGWRATEMAQRIEQRSMLGHWPVQLALVPPRAPFLQGADVLLAADCAPFAYAGFHQDFIKGHALLVACPKLDDFHAHLARLTEILRQSQVKSLTIVHMEVPCCSGLTHMAKEAMKRSGKALPLKEITIGIKGEQRS